MTTLNKQIYYPFLDGFRALAILWVIILHLNFNFYPTSFFPGFDLQWFDRFSRIGALGVDIFFVISGFLISGLLFEDLSSRIRIRRFYLRRSFKILPQYIFVVLSGIVLVFLFESSHRISMLSILSYMFLFQNYVLPIGMLGHLWSIAVEEHFYLVYPLILQGVCALGGSIEQRKRKLLYIFLFLIVLVFIIRRQTFISFPYNKLLLFQMTHVRIDALLSGCVIKLLEPVLTGPRIKRIKFLPWACFLSSIGLFYLLFLRFDPCRSTTYVYANMASSFLLISALCGFRPLLTFTELPWMRWIGKNSYGIYLWHYPVIFVVGIIFQGHMTIPAILATGAFTILVGAASTVTIENYFLNIRKKLVP